MTLSIVILAQAPLRLYDDPWHMLIFSYATDPGQPRPASYNYEHQSMLIGEARVAADAEIYGI